MKITDVTLYKIILPTDTWLLLSLQTDEGITGWGEVSSCRDEVALQQVIEEARDYLLGKDPLSIQSCTKPLHTWSFPLRQNDRAFSFAWSGIDQALWDVMAKHYKVPLYQLYGAEGKEGVSLYANLNKALRQDRRTDKLVENATKAKEAGFAILKCTPFDEITPENTEVSYNKSFERLDAIASVLPFERISIDCHQRFQLFSLAGMLCWLIEHHGNPFWLEDPVGLEDYDLLYEIVGKYPQLRLIAGESACTISQLSKVMCNKFFNAVMPDVKCIGGPSVVKSLIPVAEGLGKKVSLHNPSGIIATAHSAHLMAICRNPLPLEFPFGSVENRSLMSFPHERIENGVYKFTDGYGIGLELTEDTMKQFALRSSHGKWVKY